MRLEEIIARGVYAAVLTPFNNELEPEPTLFVEHCQWLLANGCDGLAPFGTTGEGVSLTLEQKLLLLRAASEAGLPMNRIIAGTGTCALEDAVQFSIAATELGCEGVLCLPPFYYKEPEEEGLYAFYSELIQRVNNDTLRLFLYHFPKMSGVSIDASLINRLLTEYPNAVAGLKDSSGDWENTQMLIESFPDFTVFSGSEEFLLDNLEAGGAGCISATANFTSRLAHEVFTSWRDTHSGAYGLQASLTRLRHTLEGFPFIPALKLLKARQSGKDSWCNMLPPMVPLTAKDQKTLETAISDFDLIDCSFI